MSENNNVKRDKDVEIVSSYIEGILSMPFSDTTKEAQLKALKKEFLRQWEKGTLTDSQHCSIEANIDFAIYNLKGNEEIS